MKNLDVLIALGVLAGVGYLSWKYPKEISDVWKAVADPELKEEVKEANK